MKRKALVSAVLALGLLTAAGCGAKTETGTNGSATNGSAEAPSETKVYKIGISQIVEHPALDATRNGFLAALKDSGLVEKQNLEVDIQIAQGDPTNNMSIAQKFAGDKKDLVLAIATPSAQAAVQAIKDTPVLFSAVTDPLGAKLVADMKKPGSNVTGVSDTHPDEIAKLMEFVNKQFPNIKTIGTIANEGEQNSVVQIQKAEEALNKLGIKVIRTAISNGSEVKQAAESLVGRVDAIYIPKDNTVISTFESVLSVAEKNKKPLFVGDIDSVKRGGFATFGYEFFDIGYTTGKMAVEILKEGKKPADLAVRFPEKLELYMNLKAAKNQGIEVTPELKKLADAKNIIE
ncbi:ABC transporter substrate-binding protein [Paenibacillus turpanensis]|uniref:ABC transporter substrate-binding protein n=1 Tax=Paenibacillus turpanensis TaxID=2689078 RepID=UPI00140E06B9|nr:ABC transporter substrate-binding protein [Paenibacillus turpanensis]